MKHLKFLSVLALALAFSASAYAETQTVKVSGSVDAKWIYKENFDLREGNDVSVVPVGAALQAAPSGAGATAQTGNDGADWFMSTVQVEIAADLTDNVSVVINLFNQRDWNANIYDNTVSTPVGANEFDLGVDLAYVTLKEAFYAPLTLTLGRQDVEFGRGLIFGNFQVQDPNASIVANEFSAVTSYDAARATLDFEPWTLDFVYANIAQADANDEDDRNFWWLNVNYQFSEYNAVWEAYAYSDSDRNTLDALPTAAVTGKTQQTWGLGTRAQFDPVSNMTLGAEFSYQFGDNSASTATGVVRRDVEAYMFDIFGEYRWSDHAYKPYVGLEYFLTTGDDTTSTGSFEGWNGLFRSPTYGVIHDYLETYYQTALSGDGASSSNLHTFFVSGGFAPMEDLSIGAKYYWFWADEDIINTSNGGTQNVGSDLGTELNVDVTYDYTEDVTFTLGLAWYFPGEVYEDALVTAGGTNGVGEVDTTASQVVAGMNVTF
jgi:hypothetical protein